MPQGFTFEEALEEPKKKPFSYLEAISDDIQFPQMGERATLPEYLAQPQPYLSPDRGGLVRSDIPGAQQPEDLQQRLGLVDGRLALPSGEQVIPDTIRQHGIDDEGLDQGGFSAQAAGIPPSSEAEQLPSTDIFDVGQRTRSVTPQLPEDTRRLELGKAAESGFELPLPEEDNRILNVPQELIDATKYGPAGPAVQLMFGQPKKTTAEDPQTALERGMFMASLELPLGPDLGRKASIAATEIQREIYNLAQGVPQFMNTEEGALATLASMTAPGKLGVEAYFTYDMLKATWEQMKQTGYNWDEMSKMERLRALTRIVGTGLMGYFIGKHAVKGTVKAAADITGKPTPVTTATPEQRADRSKSVLEKGGASTGSKWTSVPGELPGHKDQVAHTLDNGNVVVSEKNLHARLERDVAAGVKMEDAIDNIVSEEANHSALVTMPGGREIGAAHWNNFTGAEKWAFKRLLFGKRANKVRLKDWQYGAEAIRFAMRRIDGMKPGEHIFGTRGQIFESKMLTAVLDVIGWIRKRTKASKTQLDHLDRLQEWINQRKKGKQDASSQPIAEGVSESEVRTPVGEEAPLRQQGEAAPAQAAAAAPVAQTAQVPLSEVVGTKAGKNMPDWVKHAMTQAGLDPNRPLNDIDLADPKIREAVKNDPALTKSQKNRILKTGSAKKAPPTAPTGEAPTGQAPKGKVTKPAAATTAAEPATTAPISPAAIGVKEQELRQIIARTTELQRQPFSVTSVMEMKKLAARQYELEKSMGQTPGQKAGHKTGGIGEVLAMTRKPSEIADELGLEYRGSMYGRDQYVLRQMDEKGMSGVTVTVPEGSTVDVVKAKLRERAGESLAMTRKGRYTDESGREHEVEPPKGDRIVTVKRPDGSTYEASYGDKRWVGYPGDPYSIATLNKEGKWSHGMTRQGEKIVEDTLAMTRKMEADHEDLKRQFPGVEWSSRNEGNGNYLVDPDGRIGKINSEHDGAAVAILKSEGKDVGGEGWDRVGLGRGEIMNRNRGWSRAVQVDSPNGKILYAGNPYKGLTSKQKAMLINYGIENDVTVINDTGSGAFRDNILHDASGALSMTRKEEAPMDEKQVAVRIASSLHGAILDPEVRKATFNEVADLILKQPKENWPKLLTEFESQFAGKEISETEKQLAKVQAMASSGQLGEGKVGARIVNPSAIDAKVKDIFGGLDREGLDRRLIFELNHEPEVVTEGKSKKVKSKLGGKRGTEVVESKIVEPSYTYRGRWESVLKAIRTRDPSMPESVIRSRYVDRIHQFLAYAPSETLRRLIIAEGAADRFLGREIVTDEQGQRVVRYTRVIPEPNMEPAVMEMEKAPSTDNPTEFQKFCAARGITPEKGRQLLDEYRAESGRQMIHRKFQEEAIQSKYAPKPGATKEEAEAVLREGRAAMADLKKLREEEKKGERYNRERRDNAVNFLADRLVKESEPPEALPNRSEVDLDQIWYDHPDGHKGYTEFTPEQGSNSLLLREHLGRGAPVPGKTASKLTRGITNVINETSGEVSSLSTYRHPTNGQVMIYDPARPPGEEGKAMPGDKYIRLNKLLGRGYRVKSYMLVADPVTDFHQKWAAEGKRSSEQVFDSRLGTEAEARGRGRVVALSSLINEKFPTEGGEFDDTGEVTPESMYALNAWLRSKGGQTWGFFGTDPQALIRGPITSVEADSIYRAFKENKVKSVDDWQRVIDRMQTDRKIAESKPLAEAFRLSPWEYCFTSAIEKIARKRYRELVTGTGHYGPDALGFPNPEATDFREKIKKYPPLPKNFAEEYGKLQGEAADKLWNTLTEDQKTRYRLVEYHRQNELLNALQYAYDTAKEVQSQHLGTGGSEYVEGPITTTKDTLAFRQRAIAEYGDTARQEVEQDAVRKTVSRQYTGKPVPRELGPAPEPGERITARGLTRQVPEYEEMGTTKIPGSQRSMIRDRLEEGQPDKGTFPIYPTTPGEIGGEGFTGKPPEVTPEIAQPVPYGREKGFVPSESETSKAAYQQALARQYRLNDPARREGDIGPFLPDSLAMTRKEESVGTSSRVHGVANVYQRDMVAQGRASIDFADPDSAPLMTKQDMIEAGREAVINGDIQPIKSMLVAKESQAETGAPWLTWMDMAGMRYHDYQLRQLADALLDQHSPEAKQARMLADEWSNDYNQVAKAGTARQMHVLQGYNIIGPADMQSPTFVRRMYAKAVAASEGDPGRSEEYNDLTPEAQKWVDEKVAAIQSEARQLEEAAKGLDAATQKGIEVKHDDGNKIAIEKAKAKLEEIQQRALDRINKRSPGGVGDVLAMAAKSDKMPEITTEEAIDMVDLGMTVMGQLSADGKMSDVNWKKVMEEKLKNRPDLIPHLDHIRALSEKTRMDFVNNEIGTGDPYTSAREHFTRKQPTIEESKKAIARALAVDPQARNISPMEAYHIWNYLRLRFFNAAKPEWDIRTIRIKAGEELGVGATRLFRAMSSNRSMKEPTDLLLKKMRDEQRVRSQATNWLKNLEYPKWFRIMRAFPRAFFFDKILGHGLVPLITHAAPMLFNPWAWGNYYRAWAEMYKMAYLGGRIDTSKQGGNIYKMPQAFGEQGKKMSSENYHEARMQELMGHERFEWWKRRGLEHDPFKYSDDYMIEWMYNLFEDKGMGGRALAKVGIPGRKFLQALVGGRSFDVLKQLRYAEAERWLNSMPEHLRTPEMGDLIADSVNHGTGIVKKNFGEAGNWLMFAPKLEGSRWAWLIRDTVKAADYLRKSDATLEQKEWAKKELYQKGAVLALYWSALGSNAAFLKLAGSDQEINAFDPTKSDFMQFKAAGLKMGVLSPIIGIFKLFATLLHDEFGERTNYEKLTNRQRAAGEHLWDYARGKASPIASFGLEMASAQSTYPTRPLEFLPWSEGMTRRQRLSGVEPYGVAEYGLQTFAPIPLEEVLREVWGEMGVDKETMHKWIRALVVGGAMAGTGARLSADADVEE